MEDSLPQDVLTLIFTNLSERGAIRSDTAAVCARWASTLDALAIFWQQTARVTDFLLVQWCSNVRPGEHVRIKHVPTASTLDVFDVGVYDAEPRLTLKDGEIIAEWAQCDAATGKRALMQREMRISPSGLRWLSSATSHTMA